MSPLGLTFVTHEASLLDGGAGAPVGGAGAPVGGAGAPDGGLGEYSVIFKAGDDLRQDQLVLQIIILMDRLLREQGLDLELTPYRALATAEAWGSEEEVALQFLVKHQPESDAASMSGEVCAATVASHSRTKRAPHRRAAQAKPSSPPKRLSARTKARAQGGGRICCGAS